MTEEVWTNEDWLDALGYPPRDPILWWGPPTTTQQLNITGLVIGGSGVLLQDCLAPVADPTVITFPRIEQSLVYIKLDRSGETRKLTFSMDFRTFNKGGVLFYHSLDNDKSFISVGQTAYLFEENLIQDAFNLCFHSLLIFIDHHFNSILSNFYFLDEGMDLAIRYSVRRS